MRLFLVFVAVLFGWSGMAWSHSWYGKYRDPIYNSTTCCGGSDCAPLPEHAIRVTPLGLRVTLTAEEANAINPNRHEPFDMLINFDRLLQSEDGKPHICLQPTQNEFDLRQGYYCIFLPPNG